MLNCNWCGVTLMTSNATSEKRGTDAKCPACGKPPLAQIYVCIKCGSTNVGVLEYINPNTNTVIEADDLDFNLCRTVEQSGVPVGNGFMDLEIVSTAAVCLGNKDGTSLGKTRARCCWHNEELKTAIASCSPVEMMAVQKACRDHEKQQDKEYKQHDPWA